MIRSIQNITLSILVVSALALVSSTVVTNIYCASPSNCLAATTLYKLSYEKDFKVAQSTQTLPPERAEFSFENITKAAKTVSTYSLAIAITTMIALEAFELRYLKIFLTSKKRRTSVSHR